MLTTGDGAGNWALSPGGWETLTFPKRLGCELRQRPSQILGSRGQGARLAVATPPSPLLNSRPPYSGEAGLTPTQEGCPNDTVPRGDDVGSPAITVFTHS